MICVNKIIQYDVKFLSIRLFQYYKSSVMVSCLPSLQATHVQITKLYIV